jgi:hypothetical protein
MAWQIALVVVGVNVRKEENHVVRTVFYHGLIALIFGRRDDNVKR